MKEYAFTKWLVPTLQADGTERDMVYNEQMGIFTVRGENQFQKGSIDTQHTMSLLVLKGEISIPTNDKRKDVCSLPEGRFFCRQPNASVPKWQPMYTDTYWSRLFHWRNRIFSGYNHMWTCYATPFSKKRIISCLKCWKTRFVPSSWKCGILSSACINKKTSSSTLSAGKIPSLVFYI